MSLTRIVAPTVRPLELDAAKLHLRVEHNEHDELIDSLIDAAIGHVDGQNGWLRHALEVQTWELRLDCFPPCIEVPLPPLVSVDEVAYLDRDGALTTLAADQYQVEPSSGVKWAMIAPAHGRSWPSTYAVRGAVRVVFTCGYPRLSDDSPPEPLPGVPPELVTALKFQVEVYYGRDPTRAQLLQETADRFAQRFRSLAQ